MDFLRKKEISTVESLDTRLDEISQTAVSVMGSMKKSEKRIKAINTILICFDLVSTLYHAGSGIESLFPKAFRKCFS